MSGLKRLLIVVACIVLLAVSWLVAVSAKSDVQKQSELVEQALALIDDEIYIRAYPLLEEAIGFNTDETYNAENILKSVYIKLFDQSGFRRRYIELLEKQLRRSDALPEVFLEAANFHIDNRRLPDALSVLKDGIDRTGDAQLISLYEQERYAFRVNRTNFDEIMTGFNSTYQVMVDGLWGLARIDGSLAVPCSFDKISTYSMERAVAMIDGEVIAVDRSGNRILKLHENATDIGNFANNRVTLLIDGRWHRATSEFALGAATFEMIGMHSEGNAPARENGRWGVVNLDSEWVIPAEHDEVIMDELGRAYGQGSAFVRNGNSVTLIVNGSAVGEAFEDARPFNDENFAAVKKNGLWGFIDISGEVVIDYQFEDALSYGQHLAAVRVDGLWGYICINGNLVIEPQFIEAKSFSGGSAPVLADGGWRIISLIEFTSGGGLF